MRERGGTVGLAVCAAVLWGLWWIPVRALEAAGLTGAWVSLAITLAALPVLGLVARGAPLLPARAVIGALTIGLAVTLYSISLSFTEVVRAVLLFYLAPAWSTAIECLFMGRRWRWRSAAAIGLSLLGVATIFRFEVSGGGWSGGDMLALTSGFAWSVGAALIFAAPGVDTGRRFAGLAFIAALGGVAVASVAVVVTGTAPGVATLSGAAPAASIVLATGTLYVAPVLLITLWAALRLAPAVMSFLLTAEILSGVASSAIFLAEPFGVAEAAGAMLVVAGAVVEATTPAVTLRDPAQSA